MSIDRLSSLPDELLLQIGESLRVPELGRLAQCSNRLKDIAQDLLATRAAEALCIPQTLKERALTMFKQLHRAEYVPSEEPDISIEKKTYQFSPVGIGKEHRGSFGDKDFTLSESELLYYRAEGDLTRIHLPEANFDTITYADGKVYCASSKTGKVLIIDRESGNTLHTLIHEGPNDTPSASIVLHVDKKRHVITGCSEGMINVWDPETEEKKRFFVSSDDDHAAVDAIATTNEYLIVLSSNRYRFGKSPNDNPVAIFQLGTYERRHRGAGKKFTHALSVSNHEGIVCTIGNAGFAISDREYNKIFAYFFETERLITIAEGAYERIIDWGLGDPQQLAWHDGVLSVLSKCLNLDFNLPMEACFKKTRKDWLNPFFVFHLPTSLRDPYYASIEEGDNVAEDLVLDDEEPGRTEALELALDRFIAKQREERPHLAEDLSRLESPAAIKG